MSIFTLEFLQVYTFVMLLICQVSNILIANRVFGMSLGALYLKRMNSEKRMSSIYWFVLGLAMLYLIYQTDFFAGHNVLIAIFVVGMTVIELLKWGFLYWITSKMKNNPELKEVVITTCRETI